MTPERSFPELATSHTAVAANTEACSEILTAPSQLLVTRPQKQSAPSGPWRQRTEPLKEMLLGGCQVSGEGPLSIQLLALCMYLCICQNMGYMVCGFLPPLLGVLGRIGLGKVLIVDFMLRLRLLP